MRARPLVGKVAKLKVGRYTPREASWAKIEESEREKPEMLTAALLCRALTRGTWRRARPFGPQTPSPRMASLSTTETSRTTSIPHAEQHTGITAVSKLLLRRTALRGTPALAGKRLNLRNISETCRPFPCVYQRIAKIMNPAKMCVLVFSSALVICAEQPANLTQGWLSNT